MKYFFLTFTVIFMIAVLTGCSSCTKTKTAEIIVGDPAIDDPIVQPPDDDDPIVEPPEPEVQTLEQRIIEVYKITSRAERLAAKLLDDKKITKQEAIRVSNGAKTVRSKLTLAKTTIQPWVMQIKLGTSLINKAEYIANDMLRFLNER